MALTKSITASNGIPCTYIQARSCAISAVDKTKVAVTVALFVDANQRGVNNTPADMMGDVFEVPFDPASDVKFYEQVYTGLKALDFLSGAVDA